MHYSIADTRPDQHGVLRAGAVSDLAESELERYDFGPFQGADDLPDGVEFARGTGPTGTVIIYREAS
jgi:hypothetical protein